VAHRGKLYEMVWWFVGHYLRWYYRELTVLGLENLPPRGGGVLVSWHPNGLMDPGLIFVSFPRSVVFGARDGLFRVPLLGPLMTRMGAVPLYRSIDTSNTDPTARRARNAESLRGLAAAVVGDRFANFFPEGDSHDEAAPQPLKSGTARFLRQVWGQLPDEGVPPVLVPVEVHYSRKHAWLSRALIAYHPPIPLPRPPRGGDEQANRAWDAQATSQIAERLDVLACGTADWETTALLHHIRRLSRAEQSLRSGGVPTRGDMGERASGLAWAWARHRALVRDAPQSLGGLREQVTCYVEGLERVGLRDHELEPVPVSRRGLAVLAAAFFLAPVWSLALLVHALPLALLWSASRWHARRQKDIASIRVTLGFVLLPVSWVAAAVAGAVLWGSAAAGVGTGLLVVVGFALWMRLVVPVGAVARAVRAGWRRRRHPELVSSLREQRARIYDTLVAGGLSQPAAGAAPRHATGWRY